MRPPLSEEKWRGVATKRQKVMGAPIPDSEVGVLAKYLASQNGAK